MTILRLESQCFYSVLEKLYKIVEKSYKGDSSSIRKVWMSSLFYMNTSESNYSFKMGKNCPMYRAVKLNFDSIQLLCWKIRIKPKKNPKNMRSVAFERYLNLLYFILRSDWVILSLRRVKQGRNSVCNGKMQIRKLIS